jgi:hypothetical protein
MTLWYTNSGFANPATNHMLLTSYQYQSDNPSALLDKISVFMDRDDNGTYEYELFLAGDSKDNYDDVPDYIPRFFYGNPPDTYVYENSPGKMQFSAWGGVGAGSPSSPHCTQVKSLQ